MHGCQILQHQWRRKTRNLSKTGLKGFWNKNIVQFQPVLRKIDESFINIILDLCQVYLTCDKCAWYVLLCRKNMYYWFTKFFSYLLSLRENAQLYIKHVLTVEDFLQNIGVDYRLPRARSIVGKLFLNIYEKIQNISKKIPTCKGL